MQEESNSQIVDQASTTLVGRCFQIIQRDYQNKQIGPDSWMTIWHEACNPDEELKHDQYAVMAELCKLGCDISADYED